MADPESGSDLCSGEGQRAVIPQEWRSSSATGGVCGSLGEGRRQRSGGAGAIGAPRRYMEAVHVALGLPAAL